MPSTSGNSATGGSQHGPKFNANDSKTRDVKWWKDQGFDPHKFKAEVLKQQGMPPLVSRYDMYVHKSGEVLLRRKNTSDFIRIGEYIK